jgi:hypothetical protein
VCAEYQARSGAGCLNLGPVFRQWTREYSKIWISASSVTSFWGQPTPLSVHTHLPRDHPTVFCWNWTYIQRDQKI